MTTQVQRFSCLLLQMSEPKSAAGEQVYAAEPLQSKETCVSKKEVSTSL